MGCGGQRTKRKRDGGGARGGREKEKREGGGTGREERRGRLARRQSGCRGVPGDVGGSTTRLGGSPHLYAADAPSPPASLWLTFPPPVLLGGAAAAEATESRRAGEKGWAGRAEGGTGSGAPLAEGREQRRCPSGGAVQGATALGPRGPRTLGGYP